MSDSISDFTVAELAAMALDHLMAMVDKVPDSMALAWAPLDEWLSDAKLDAFNDVNRELGQTDKGAIAITTRVAELTQQYDAAKLGGMVAVAGRILGLVAPGGREEVRKVLKGLPPASGSAGRT